MAEPYTEHAGSHGARQCRAIISREVATAHNCALFGCNMIEKHASSKSPPTPHRPKTLPPFCETVYTAVARLADGGDAAYQPAFNYATSDVVVAVFGPPHTTTVLRTPVVCNPTKALESSRVLLSVATESTRRVTVTVRGCVVLYLHFSFLSDLPQRRTTDSS